MNPTTPPTDEDLSSWVITGQTQRPVLATRLQRTIGEIRRLREALTRMEREAIAGTAEIIRLSHDLECSESREQSFAEGYRTLRDEMERTKADRR